MTKDPEAKAREQYRKLYSLVSGREGKYIRNFNRYQNNGVRRENLWSPNVTPQAYVTPAIGTEGTQTQINVLNSATDALVSKVSQANVRPYFSSIAGDYDTTSVTTKIQQFFDVWLDEQHAYPKSLLCFRDACIFDYGVMGVNPETQSIERVAPWEYFVDPAEYATGAITQTMRMRKYYPLAGLRDRIDNPELKSRLEDNPQTQDEYIVYHDLYHGKKWEFYDAKLISDPVDVEYEMYGGLYRRPYVELFYTRPIKAFFSISLIDILYPIQKQIDELVRRLDAATRNAILGMVFVNRQSGVKASDLENGWKSYSYTPSEGGAPVTVINPAPVNQQFIDLLSFYIEKAYEMSGVSQLSAQSKKPNGLDSGKALQTMEDIESDRFNTQLQQFVHFLVDTTRVCIDTFPKSVPILPRKIAGEKVTWGDARKQRDAMSIEFSAASSLSKDPAEKRAEIEFLAQQGLIDNSQIADFYNMPDLENAYGLATASSKACDKVIDRCIKDGDTEYNETIDLEMLKKKTIKQINRMEAAGDDEKYIDNLMGLLRAIDETQKSITQWTTPAPPTTPPPPAPPAPPSPPPEPIRQTVLDGSQMTAMAGILAQVQSGQISPDSASALLSVSYPNIPPEILAKMINIPITQGAPAPTENIEGAPNA